jgi:hypothetical protein
MSDNMTAFAGDLSGMWTLQNRPPLHHLTWDWWWWLVMLEDPDGKPSGRQLMVLWSTKDNPLVELPGPLKDVQDSTSTTAWPLMAWFVHGGSMEPKCMSR